MILFHKENWGSVYTIDEQSYELFYSPIYQNDIINLTEFTPVDECDIPEEDMKEFKELQNYLIQCVKCK